MARYVTLLEGGNPSLGYLGSWLGRGLRSVRLGLQYCVISYSFTHSALRRFGMVMAVRLGIRVMVRVSLWVNIMILFCRSIALLSVFYAFHIYIPQFRIIHVPSRYTSGSLCDL